MLPNAPVVPMVNGKTKMLLRNMVVKRVPKVATLWMHHKHVPIVQKVVIIIKLLWKCMVSANARHAFKVNLRIKQVPKNVPSVQRVPFLCKRKQLQTRAQIVQKENTIPSLVMPHHACHAHLQTPQVPLSVLVVNPANTRNHQAVLIAWSVASANMLIKEI